MAKKYEYIDVTSGYGSGSLMRAIDQLNLRKLRGWKVIRGAGLISIKMRREIPEPREKGKAVSGLRVSDFLNSTGGERLGEAL